VTGASQGIGAAVANLFLDRGYNVLGNSRKISHRNELQRSDRLALSRATSVWLRRRDDRWYRGTAVRLGRCPGEQRGHLLFEALHRLHDRGLRALSSTNLDGFIYTTQLAVKQMLSQKSGGSVVSITTSIVDHPLAAFTASVP